MLLSFATLCFMCRNIRTLHNFEPAATEDEVRSAALQYVRKVSGTTKPSKANTEPFERAVEEIAAITSRLLEELVSNAPPKDREIEAAKARARAAERYAATG
ncbi:MAG: COGs COG0840 [uncultured Solirubrobacteraceae bacterium]|uniref:COGs COG0840 n=1 Tax=uncultured Solirubrobacteraceae bacterium TaxID=1162706 RepID=A0A6J4SCH6_9ACTN|nr:MAG: COGs COG0840 [uncultured Solirubrobacteraceae bacterium]